MGVSRDHRSRVGDRHHMGFRDVDDPSLGVSRGLRMNDPLVDRNLDAKMDGNLDGNLDGNRDHHTNDLLVYRNLDASSDENRGHRMSVLLDGHLKGGDHHDVLVDHHKNVTDDLNLDVNPVNRNCVRCDLMRDAMTDGDL